jgi:hypothetical protein
MCDLSHFRAGEPHIQVHSIWVDAELAPIGTSRALTIAKGETHWGVELMDGPDHCDAHRRVRRPRTGFEWPLILPGDPPLGISGTIAVRSWRRFPWQTRCSGDGVLGEDPPDLGNDLGMILAEMAGRDYLLGGDPIDMGAGVAHQTVGPIARRRARADRDDRVDLQRRRGGQPGKDRQDRRSPL